MTSRNSFEDIEKWKNWAKDFQREDVIPILIGTKLDNEEERDINYMEAFTYANKNGMSYFEISSQNSKNID